jgi:hypothetical protein
LIIRFSHGTEHAALSFSGGKPNPHLHADRHAIHDPT